MTQPTRGRPPLASLDNASDSRKSARIHNRKVNQLLAPHHEKQIHPPVKKTANVAKPSAPNRSRGLPLARNRAVPKHVLQYSVGSAPQKKGIGSAEDYSSCAKLLQSKAMDPSLSQRAQEADPTSILGKVKDFVFWARADPFLYNDEETTKRAQVLTGTTSKYQRAKAASVARLMGFIAAHPNDKIRLLSDLIEDPEDEQKEEYRLVLLVRGLKTAHKYELLNYAMMIFAVNMYKLKLDGVDLGEIDMNELSDKQVADAKYAPSSLETYHKHIFAWLTHRQCFFAFADFKGKEGSFDSFYRDDFAKTLVHRPDLGKRKAAVVDLDAAKKVRSSGIDPCKRSMKHEHESTFDWAMRIFAFSAGEGFMLRGGKEPSGLLLSSFSLHIQMGGEYNGKEFLQLEDFGAVENADKTHKLSLGNPYQRDKSGYHKFYANEDDLYCMVRLFKYIRDEHLLPAMKYHSKKDSFFFCRRAPQKELRKREKAGCYSEAGMHKNQKWGENYFNPQIRILAHRCKFNDAENYTMRSNRRAGITKLANSRLGTNAVQAAARHKSIEANKLYQEESEIDHVARSKVMHGYAASTSKKEENSIEEIDLSKTKPVTTSFIQSQLNTMPQVSIVQQPNCMNQVAFNQEGNMDPQVAMAQAQQMQMQAQQQMIQAQRLAMMNSGMNQFMPQCMPQGMTMMTPFGPMMMAPMMPAFGNIGMQMNTMGMGGNMFMQPTNVVQTMGNCHSGINQGNQGNNSTLPKPSQLPKRKKTPPPFTGICSTAKKKRPVENLVPMYAKKPRNNYYKTPSPSTFLKNNGTWQSTGKDSVLKHVGGADMNFGGDNDQETSLLVDESDDDEVHFLDLNATQYCTPPPLEGSVSALMTQRDESNLFFEA